MYYNIYVDFIKREFWFFYVKVNINISCYFWRMYTVVEKLHRIVIEVNKPWFWNKNIFASLYTLTVYFNMINTLRNDLHKKLENDL